MLQALQAEKGFVWRSVFGKPIEASAQARVLGAGHQRRR